jgi:hypothetical protein
MNQMRDNRDMNLGEYLGRALLWGLGASIVGIQSSKAIKVAVFAPFAERAFGFNLEGILEELSAAIERERQERERQEKVARIRAALRAINVQPISTTAQSVELLSPQPPQLATSSRRIPLELEIDAKWREVIVHPSVVLVLGKRGSGKSALGYRLLELFRCQLTPYVLGLPEQAQKHLPDWMGMVQTIEEVPQKSIVLVDEAYLTYHSRESLKSASRDMSRMLNLSRQRDQTLVFVTPEARQLDKNIVSSANVVVFKDLGMLQLQFDRPELNKLAAGAKQAFETVRGDRRRWSYIYAPDADFMGLMENLPPTFWSTKLSRVFATGGEAPAMRLRRRMTIEERLQKAKELHQSGMSFGDIGKMLGVTKSTAYNYVKGYPYAR